MKRTNNSISTYQERMFLNGIVKIIRWILKHSSDEDDQGTEVESRQEDDEYARTLGHVDLYISFTALIEIFFLFLSLSLFLSD